VLVALLAAGCQSPREKAGDALKSVASWAATSAMVGRSWLGGEVPTVYAKQTLDAAEQVIQDTDRKLRSEELPGDLRTTIAAELRTRAAAVAAMRGAVEHGDSARAGSEADRMRVGADSLRALADALSRSR
jgi:hypothetical protein